MAGIAQSKSSSDAYTRGAPSSSLAYKLCKPRSSIDLDEAFCALVAKRMTGYPYYASFNALFSSAKDGCQLREIIGHLLAQWDIDEDTESERGDPSTLLHLRFRNADLQEKHSPGATFVHVGLHLSDVMFFLDWER